VEYFLCENMHQDIVTEIGRWFLTVTYYMNEIAKNYTKKNIIVRINRIILYTIHNE